MSALLLRKLVALCDHRRYSRRFFYIVKPHINLQAPPLASSNPPNKKSGLQTSETVFKVRRIRPNIKRRIRGREANDLGRAI